MTDRVQDYVKQWLTPGVLITVLGWIVLAAGGWFRLGALERGQAELTLAVQASTRADQEAARETVRYQERVANLLSRVESLERFREAQTDYNANTMATLAVLKKTGG